jgi:hypothetical protein
MKKIVLPFVSLLVLSSMMFTSCKKKDKDEEEDIPTTPVTSVLCDGNGSASYLPVKIGNKYTYAYKFAGAAQPDATYTVTKDTTVGGKTYKKFQNDGAASVYTLFRIDSINNNVYSYYPPSGKESFIIPGTPTLNQVVESSTPGNTAKVTSISAAYTTSGCTYSNLLEITEYDNTGKPVAVSHYKKGLGVVHSGTTAPFIADLQLKAVTLK